ncbi:Sodium:dicarboxylate symporter family protein [Lojkania enalia]|uniref:Amino acid transporter n=1 Tax=Lojkania enalia TaxID=147567 RepID=A0A9P4K4Y4_9PLEO|nr:Sodium:dicarboxylate symporter family protein [Didymosphaeria enalia]
MTKDNQDGVEQVQPMASNESSSEKAGVGFSEPVEEKPKGTLVQRLVKQAKTPGSAIQIIIAAAIAIAIGMAVSASVDEVPEAAPAILEIPGSLWLRALKAAVLPLIIVAIMIAMQDLRAMAKEGAQLATYTIFWYIGTTCLAVVHSMILTDLVWRRLMVDVSATLPALDEDSSAGEKAADGAENAPHDIVVEVFESFIPDNVVGALANNELLAVLVTSIVVGLLIQGPDSSIMRAVREVERLVSIIITALIKLAPIGVFSLILANLLTLDMEAAGKNMGILIGGSIAQMAIHLFIMYPILFFAFTRKNPFTYWMKNSPAWITAWGTASSAATMPVTLRCVKARGVPQRISRFTIPLGTLINMDGTAIYFPMVVVFLAATQGMKLNAGDYTIIVLLSTLSSIATTPIPSSSLVLTIMIANAVNVPVTGMYAIVVAFDWLIDRFRTMTNVSGDMFAARVMQKLTGITDGDIVDVNGTESHEEMQKGADRV